MSGRGPRWISVTRGRLPAGYTEHTYIRATGTQYVDTGLVCNKSDDYIITIIAKLTNNAMYAGANGYLQFQASVAGGQKATIEVSYKNNVETIRVDGVLKSTMDWTSSYFGQNVKIGILKLGDVENTWFSGAAQSGDVYEVEIKKAGASVRHFIPCTNPDGVVGLFDLVSGSFHKNAGTGVFAPG